MANKDNDIRFERVDRYLSGAMSAEEVRAFENDLVGDEALREELEMQQKVKELMKGKRRLDLEERMRQIGAEVEAEADAGPEVDEEPPVIRSSSSRWRLWAAAAGILLVAVVSLVVIQPGETDTKALFAENFALYAAGGKARLPEDPEPIDYALDHYFKGEYGQAAIRFEQVLADSGLIERDRMYMGVSYLGAARYAQSDSLFAAVLDSGSQAYHPVARWYRALGHLAQEAPEAARQALEALRNEGSGYKETEVKALLKALE